jgi:hypothetical protein
MPRKISEVIRLTDSSKELTQSSKNICSDKNSVYLQKNILVILLFNFKLKQNIEKYTRN